MIPILNALAPVFLLTALGYVLRGAKFATGDVWEAVDHLTYYILFPALLTKTLVRADLGSVPAGAFIFVTLGSVTIMAAFLLVAFLLLRHIVTGPVFTSLFQGGVRFQSLIAVALSGTLFKEGGLTFAALAVAAMIPLVQLYTVLVLLIFGEGQPAANPVTLLKRLILNPLTLACVVGLILNRTGVPGFVYDTLSILGAGSIALTLLAVGAGLRLPNAAHAGSLVAGIMALRLIGMPVLVLGLSWLAGLDGLGRSVAVIAAGVPTASTAYTMARKMGGDAELMAQIITFQSLAAALTLPIFIYISEHS